MVGNKREMDGKQTGEKRKHGGIEKTCEMNI